MGLGSTAKATAVAKRQRNATTLTSPARPIRGDRAVSIQASDQSTRRVTAITTDNAAKSATLPVSKA